MLLAGRSDWYRHCSITLISIGFNPTIFDRDFWINLAESVDHYEYICTYEENFRIASKESYVIM